MRVVDRASGGVDDLHHVARKVEIVGRRLRDVVRRAVRRALLLVNTARVGLIHLVGP